MVNSTQDIQQCVREQLQLLSPHQPLLLALSGGCDSLLLLDVLAELKRAGDIDNPLLVVHINHQLQPEADDWEAVCREACEQRGVNFIGVSLTSAPLIGMSVEAWAREQRYAVLAAHLPADGVLLTGHHADDQAETFLLQSLRGAGVSGLAAMPATMLFAAGELWRPLLRFSRDVIEVAAKQRQLQWITDSSNADRQFDRNFIRHEILPLLKQRWPSCEQTLSRAAQLCAQADALNTSTIKQAYATAVRQPLSLLHIPTLQQYPLALQMEMIRHWCAQLTVACPQYRHCQQVVALVARTDNCSRYQVCWGDVQIRRYADHLYCLTTDDIDTTDLMICWQGEQRLQLPNALGTLHAEAVIGQGIKQQAVLHCRFRQGGERFHPAGRQGSHPLKKCFQEWGVPPWLRNRIPLLYDGEHCVAVVGYAIAEQYLTGPDEPGYFFRLDLC